MHTELSPTMDTAKPRQSRRHVVLVAGGSGITPLYSIASALLHCEPWTTISLLYCDVSAEQMRMRAELEQLVERGRGRLQVIHMLEHGAEAMDAHPGRLDTSIATTLLELLAGGEPAKYYLCGPREMMDVVHAALRALRVPDSWVFEERIDSFAPVLKNND